MTAGRQTYENRTMAKYDVDYSCGHSGVVNLGGKSGYRERMLEWYERKGLCPECLQAKKEKDKEAAYKAQLARAEAMGLPKLTGTPKQVSWAVDIRDKFLDKIDKNLNYYAGDDDRSRRACRTIQALADSCCRHDSARWWIDNREKCVEDTGDTIEEVLDGLASAVYHGLPLEKLDSLSDEELGKAAERILLGEKILPGITPLTKEEEAALKETEAESLAERTIKPQNMKSQVHAEIRLTVLDGGRQRLSVSTPERIDKLVTFVKELGFSWGSGAWSFNYPADSSVIRDRVCEIASAILRSGYAVELPDKSFVAQIKNDDYRKYNPRRILRNRSADGTESFIFFWNSQEEDWYKAVKRLPGAKWSREDRGVIVPSSAWAKVEEFAERNGFELSDGAHKILRRAEDEAAVWEDPGLSDERV